MCNMQLDEDGGQLSSPGDHIIVPRCLLKIMAEKLCCSDALCFSIPVRSFSPSL